MALERAVPGESHWVGMHAEHLARYQYAVQFVRGKTVIDAGTGPGYGAALLASSGAISVTAVDISADTVAQAEREYGRCNLKFVVDDCELLSKAPDSVDVICSFENIEHLHHPDKFLDRARHLLSADGLLLCSSPDLEGPYEQVDGRSTNEFHINEWHRDDFIALLSRYFGKVELYSQVSSYTLKVRKDAVNAIHEHLTYLWSASDLKLRRATGKLLGHQQDWPDFSGLSAPSPADYPIVPSKLIKAFGDPFCHYAICSNPLRP